MIFGMTTLTFVHVGLSLIGIASGLVVLLGMLAAKRLNFLTTLFLVSTVLTSVTGFLFPFHEFLPSHAVGIVSLIALAIAVYARYAGHLAHGWRRTYVISATLALYLNVFVSIVQLFQKVPALRAIEPPQSATLFKLAQGITLILFVLLTVLAVRRFKLEHQPSA
jgi:hypothetical protein